MIAFLAEKVPGKESSLTVGKLMTHVVDDLIRGTETKRSRISNVQLQNLRAARFHAVGFFYDRSADII